MNEDDLKRHLIDLAVKQKSTDHLIHQLPISQEDKHQLLQYYYSQRQQEPLWSAALNSEASQIWQESARELNNVEQRIVDDIRADGIAFSSLEELFPDYDALASLQAQAKRKQLELEMAEHKSDFKKASFTKFLHGGGGAHPELVLTDPGISECLSDTVLHIVGAYLGSACKFVRFSMQSTRVVPPGLKRAQSQRWHRDPDDRHIPKIFIYLNDVEKVGVGPFQYLKKSHTGGAMSSLFPQTSPFGMYPEDGTVEAHVDELDIVTGLGKAGTVIFADTSGIHRGGYSTEEERIMFAGIFVSAASLFGKRYVLTEDFNLSELPALQNFALT